jgi:polyhydroxyalkanoate synthesis regulator phasin
MKQRDRSRLISVEISHEAKTIYDKQPHKGEFVSEAITKHAQDSGAGLETRVEKLEKRVEKLEGEKE